MRLPIQIQVIIFRKKDKQYKILLLKRIPKKGGFWQPITGGMESEDKSKIDAAYRELNEEVGITKEKVKQVIEDVHHFKITKHYITGEPIPEVNEYVYAFEVFSDTQISFENNISHEHDEYKWCDFDEAISLLKWENNKDGFKKLRKILNI